MAVLGDVFLNLFANDIKAFTNLPGASAVNFNWRFAIPIDADEIWRGSMALAAGTLTFSLEALPRTNQPTLDLTGKDVLMFLLYNRAGNASMNFADAATNAYPIVGDPAGIDVGGDGMRFLHESAGFGAVSTTVSDITVTGTGTEVFEMAIVAKDLS